MITSNKHQKLNTATGALNAVTAALFLTVAIILICSSAGFLSAGISPIWYAHIITLLIGALVTWLGKILIIVLIAGCLIVFGFYTALSTLTFTLGRTNEKVFKGLQIATIVIDIIVFYNLIDCLKAFIASAKDISEHFSPADKAACILVAVATVLIIVCVALCIVNLATMKKPAKVEAVSEIAAVDNSDEENL